MEESIVKLLSYLDNKFHEIYEKYYKDLSIYLIKLKNLNKKNSLFKKTILKISNDIVSIFWDLSQKIEMDINTPNFTSNIIDKTLVKFDNCKPFVSLDEHQSQIDFLITSILKIMSTSKDIKNDIPRLTSKTPNLEKIRRHLMTYDRFVEEKNRKPNGHSPDPDERKLYTNLYTIKKKRDLLPECMQEKIDEIFPDYHLIKRCDDYISFVIKNKRLPDKNSEDSCERKLAMYRINQMINLNRRKHPLTPEQYAKLDMIVNHNDLLKDYITL